MKRRRLKRLRGADLRVRSSPQAPKTPHSPSTSLPQCPGLLASHSVVKFILRESDLLRTRRSALLKAFGWRRNAESQSIG